jgi:arsenate reductase
MGNEGLDSYVTVYSAHGRLDAETIKAFLEAQGIPVYIDQDTLGLIYSFTVGDLGSVGIQVRPQDVEKAKELLAAMDKGDFSNEILVEDENTVNLPYSGPLETEDDELKGRKRVLFLCTGNSARSQMAEAIVNNDCWDKWVAFSAGTNPTGKVNFFAQQVIEEADIYHQGRSKSTEEFSGQVFDLVVTVCDHANETCPLWLKQGEKVHVGFEDPAAFVGSDEEKLAIFRKTFALIRATIPPLLSKFAD